MKEIQLQIKQSVYAIPVQALQEAVTRATGIEARAVEAKLENDDAGAHALSYLSWPEIYAEAKASIRWVVGEQIDLSHKVVANARAKLVTRVGEG